MDCGVFLLFCGMSRISQQRYASDWKEKTHTKGWRSREKKKKTPSDTCAGYYSREVVPCCRGNQGSMICSPQRKRTHLERISCLWLLGGSSNNSHILASSHAAHSDLALLSSAYSRGPCSSLQPPTEEIWVYWCCANNTAQKYDCDYCVVRRLHKAVSQSLGKMFLNISEICIWHDVGGCGVILL